MLTVRSWLQAIFYMVEKYDAAEKFPEMIRELFSLKHPSRDEKRNFQRWEFLFNHYDFAVSIIQNQRQADGKGLGMGYNTKSSPTTSSLLRNISVISRIPNFKAWLKASYWITLSISSCAFMYFSNTSFPESSNRFMRLSRFRLLNFTALENGESASWFLSSVEYHQSIIALKRFACNSSFR